ncbi:hypothetical protein Ancab_016230, partial [Ancistrocladus abbreviatus]
MAWTFRPPENTCKTAAKQHSALAKVIKTVHFDYEDSLNPTMPFFLPPGTCVALC